MPVDKELIIRAAYGRTKLVSLTPGLFGQWKIHWKCFSLLQPCKQAFSLLRRADFCWPRRDSICPSATNHPSFRSSLILRFRGWGIDERDFRLQTGLPWAFTSCCESPDELSSFFLPLFPRCPYVYIPISKSGNKFLEQNRNASSYWYFFISIIGDILVKPTD